MLELCSQRRVVSSPSLFRGLRSPVECREGTVERDFRALLQEKVLVFDGATGTHLQGQNLSPDDFGGEQLNGCNEHLALSRPSSVEKVHRDYLDAGCDVIETNTFGSNPIVLAEYGLGDRAYEITLANARIATNIALEYSLPGKPRFVAGSLGPTTKLPSLGHIAFAPMAAAYRVQARGLIDGGVDLLSIETCQDMLQVKAALAGVFECFEEVHRRLPVIVSLTVETTGTMLLGTETSAALVTLDPYDIDVIGLNCATGPAEMSDHVRVLSASSPKPIFVMPNAGLPENVGGRACYRLSPAELTEWMSHFVKDLGVSIVGGCCGTTPEHIRRLVDAVGGLTPAPRSCSAVPSVSSLYQAIPLQLDPPPVLIGERTNANGSKQFRDLLGKEDWDGIVAMGKEAVREGAHMVDVCAAYVGRDEARDMDEILRRFNTQVPLPVVIDSTEAAVIERALQRIGGKAVVNSINLEDGEERIRAVVPLCRKYGAAVIALTIDEQGMAKSADAKVAIARRIHDLVVGTYGMKPGDLIVDTLTFTLGSGDEAYRRAAIETLDAIRRIKRELPGVRTLLGVSNISFGLSPAARHVLNSVFLHEATQAGLDLAIVHAGKIMPLYRIDERGRELSRRLVHDERTPTDPLAELIAYYAERKGEKKQESARHAEVEERLKQRVVDGDGVGLQADIEEALKRHSPISIINTILLGGMKTVGDLFGSGQMQLPFVLQSAEVMKSAVALLEPFLDKLETAPRGTLVLATVKGDVHDIGKNLVDIILSNNGYRVVNLGIRVPIETMLQAAEKERATAIGMSGLLVKSTLIMKENLEVMRERGLTVPVILGGAALTRRYVEEDLRPLYGGPLFYANDAFDGLRFMEKIAGGPLAGAAGSPGAGGDPDALTGSEAKVRLAMEKEGGSAPGQGRRVNTLPQAPGVRRDVPIPVPPFWGTKVVDTIGLDQVFPYINEVALIRGQWQVRRGSMGEDGYRKLLDEKIYPELKRLKGKVVSERLLEPRVVYGYFPCHSSGDDLIIYDQDLTRERMRFTFPRQKGDRLLCLADYFAPVGSGTADVVALQLVTVGRVASEHSARLFAANDYKEYLYFHGLSVEAAEALAEFFHKRIRQELGIAASDAHEIKRLFAQGYQGARYSFGYPACPNLEDQTKLFDLLDGARIGVRLTEEYSLDPEQSTNAIIVHHPQARYFTP
jgi:5-methyltetrahydrofolate--homocysteine methyltransferase